MHKFLCWLFKGHHTILRTEKLTDPQGVTYVRTWTECIECGHESPGWSYGDSYEGPRL